MKGECWHFNSIFGLLQCVNVLKWYGGERAPKWRHGNADGVRYAMLVIGPWELRWWYRHTNPKYNKVPQPTRTPVLDRIQGRK